VLALGAVFVCAASTCSSALGSSSTRNTPGFLNTLPPGGPGVAGFANGDVAVVGTFSGTATFGGPPS
jgi:hypothetical protein